MPLIHLRTDFGGTIHEDGPIEYGVSYRFHGEGPERVWVLLPDKPLKESWIEPICERLAAEARAAGVLIVARPPFEAVLEMTHASVLAPDDHPALFRPAR